MQMPNGQMIVRSPARRPSGDRRSAARATDHLYFRKRDLTDASPPARPPLNLPQQPQIVLLREGTDTSQGKGQLISNINACMAVVDSIRTTLVRRAPLPRPRSRCASVERHPPFLYFLRADRLAAPLPPPIRSQGPRGLDKLVHDDKGVTTISNDGATIMKVRAHARDRHPARSRADAQISRDGPRGAQQTDVRVSIFASAHLATSPAILPTNARVASQHLLTVSFSPA